MPHTPRSSGADQAHPSTGQPAQSGENPPRKLLTGYLSPGSAFVNGTTAHPTGRIGFVVADQAPVEHQGPVRLLDHPPLGLHDLGFLGLDDDPDHPVVVTGFKATRHRKLTTCEKDANRVLAAGRAPVEHGFAHLKNWRTLTKLRTDPARATHLLRALLVLTNIEVHR